MSRSTGPILVAGGLTWANQNLLGPKRGDKADNLFESSLGIGVATGLAAAALYGVEKIVPEAAVGIAYIALVTILFVRVGGQPTPLERSLNLIR